MNDIGIGIGIKRKALTGELGLQTEFLWIFGYVRARFESCLVSGDEGMNKLLLK